MNGTWTAITICTIILACTGTCIILYRLGWTDGYDAGRDYEHDRQYRKHLRETRANAVLQSKVIFGGADGAPPWYVKVSERRTVAMPGIPLAALNRTAPIAHRRATDTGELRALAAATDHYLAGMHADGEAYRREMHA